MATRKKGAGHLPADNGARGAGVGRMSETTEPMWKDGKCKKCSSIVEEQESTTNDADFMNRCSNQNCENYKWHYVNVNEFLDYYKHMRLK
jgi:hypothetical protein